MERERASDSLHRRLLAAFARAAQAQDHSRSLVDAARVSHLRLEDTVRSLRARRAERPAPRHRP